MIRFWRCVARILLGVSGFLCLLCGALFVFGIVVHVLLLQRDAVLNNTPAKFFFLAVPVACITSLVVFLVIAAVFTRHRKLACNIGAVMLVFLLSTSILWGIWFLVLIVNEEYHFPGAEEVGALNVLDEDSCYVKRYKAVGLYAHERELSSKDSLTYEEALEIRRVCERA